MNLSKIWIEQGQAARGIEEEYGTPQAIGYLAGETRSEDHLDRDAIWSVSLVDKSVKSCHAEHCSCFCLHWTNTGLTFIDFDSDSLTETDADDFNKIPKEEWVEKEART